MTNNILADMVGYWYTQLLIILSYIKGAVLEKVLSLNIFLWIFFWATLNYTQELEIQFLLILPELPSIFLYFPKIQPYETAYLRILLVQERNWGWEWFSLLPDITHSWLIVDPREDRKRRVGDCGSPLIFLSFKAGKWVSWHLEN